MLVKEFSTDKNLRLESERFIQERQNKDRNKASVSIDGYEAETTEKPKVEEIKTVVPEDARPKFKPVGKIDLDKLNRKPVVEKVEEKKVETSAPVVKEEPKPQPKPEPKPEFRPEPKPEPRPELKPEPKPEPKPTPAPEPAPVVKEEPKPAVVAEKPAPNPAPIVAKEVVKKKHLLPRHLSGKRRNLPWQKKRLQRVVRRKSSQFTSRSLFLRSISSVRLIWRH